MAASSLSMLALLLLMSAVTPGHSTDGEGSQDHTVTAPIIAMREVSRALEGFGDAVQEGLRQQRQSSDALTDLHTLTATVEALTQENEDLKNQLLTKNHTVGDLQRLLDNKTSENEHNVDKLGDLQVKFEAKCRESEQNLEKHLQVGDLQRLLDNKTSENERNVHKVQDLGRNLDESRRYAEKLEQLVQQLNNTQESKKKDVPVCAEQPPQKIKNLVLQYSCSRDWQMLRKGLDAEMNHSSGVYGELKNLYQYSVNPHWHMGYYGCTQLVTLLLCAGMPVDLPDESNNTLLYSAAYGGQYQLAEMLLSRGADVNGRDFYGFTPLMAAAHFGNLETLKLLVQTGADTTATDVDGHNALYYAKYSGPTAVQQYLEQLPA